MKSLLPISAAISVLCSSVALGQWVTKPSAAQLSQTPGLLHETFHSRAMNATVGYSVVLPPSYSRGNKRYPVVYWLHGGGGNECSSLFVSKAWQDGYNSQEIDEVILVFPSAFRSGYMDHSDGKIMVESMVIRELLPRIDERFRTIASRHARAAHGFSMGSSGALKFAVKYPDLFCSAVAYGGGAVDLEKTKSKFVLDILERNLGSDPARIRQNNTYHFLEENGNLVREHKIRILLICGENDSWLNSAVTFQKALLDKDIPCQLARVPGVGHSMQPLANAEGRAAAIFQNKSFREGKTKRSVASLSRQVSGVASSFRGLAVYGPTEAWATGSQGTVIRTTDAGKTWNRIEVPGSDELDFRDIEVLANGTILLMSVGAGNSSKIFRSTDTGVTWKTVLENQDSSGFFDGMAFADDGRRGVLYGDPIDGLLDVYRTRDGGETWQRVAKQQRPPLKEGEYGFAASGTGIVVSGDEVFIATGGATARVFHSRDLGENWTSHETPIRSGNESSGIFSLAFSDSLHGVSIGGDYANPTLAENNVARTTDGGKTWTPLSSVSMPHKACIRSLGENKLLACGRTGIAYSDDGGVTWRHLVHEGYFTLAVDQKSQTGFLAGSNGRVARIQVGR